KSAQIREILISESAWEEMTCLFAPSPKIKGSANIVLRTKTAEEKLNLSLNVVLEIIKVYPYGIVDFNLIRSAKGHTSSGDIIW
ncbi:hypothetical protein SJ089_15215, partial [Enterobacter hormaechei]|nr:hypothetical protein [Enterobacter hormaechei]